jgi:hypothetical protein
VALLQVAEAHLYWQALWVSVHDGPGAVTRPDTAAAGEGGSDWLAGEGTDTDRGAGSSVEGLDTVEGAPVVVVVPDTAVVVVVPDTAVVVGHYIAEGAPVVVVVGLDTAEGEPVVGVHHIAAVNVVALVPLFVVLGTSSLFDGTQVSVVKADLAFEVGSFVDTAVVGNLPEVMKDTSPDSAMLEDIRPDSVMTEDIRPDPVMTEGIRPDHAMTEGIRPDPAMTEGILLDSGMPGDTPVLDSSPGLLLNSLCRTYSLVDLDADSVKWKTHVGQESPSLPGKAVAFVEGAWQILEGGSSSAVTPPLLETASFLGIQVLQGTRPYELLGVPILVVLNFRETLEFLWRKRNCDLGIQINVVSERN